MSGEVTGAVPLRLTLTAEVWAAMADYSKPDFWAQKARAEGYPARSVYKLKELIGRYPVLPRGKGRISVLDLGAAPGSWSLYLLRTLAGRISLVACDLLPLSREHDRGLFAEADRTSAESRDSAPPESSPERPAFTFIQGDFTDAAVRARIRESGPYALVLCDAAPRTSGNRLVDTSRSAQLAQSVLDLSAFVLSPGGNLVIKFFQGEDSADLIKAVKNCFETVQTFKPKACRPPSFETYLVALKYSAQKADDRG